MLTRADSLVPIDSQKVGKPLPIVEAWMNSSHAMLVFPDAVYSTLGVKVGDPSTGMYQQAVWGVMHPQMNYWYIYFPKSAFTASGETAYKVVATDLNGTRHVCGEGVLRIYSGIIDDTADDAGNADAVSMAYVQFNGTWYAIKVIEDASGSLALELQSQVDAPTAEVTGTPYAYCKRTALFHAVTPYLDASGNVAVALEANGVEGDLASFGFDDRTGLYYRLECETDESGTLAIEIGEAQ